ncbi:MAG: hypothetical protein U0136_12740 [Bdellovibrionota bacterium]
MAQSRGETSSPAELNVQTYLEKHGYVQLIVQDGVLHDPNNTSLTYSPEDLTVVGTFRFEGISDPEDMSIIYAVEGPNNLRGAIVDAFGTYSSPEVSAVVERIEINVKKREGMAKASTLKTGA